MTWNGFVYGVKFVVGTLALIGIGFSLVLLVIATLIYFLKLFVTFLEDL